MTKLQRQKHIKNVLSTLAKDENLEIDKWDNLISVDGTFRYKSKKTVLRKERRVPSLGWVTGWSAYFKDIEVKDEKIHVMKRIA